jgi:hypothetical protein
MTNFAVVNHSYYHLNPVSQNETATLERVRRS